MKNKSLLFICSITALLLSACGDDLIERNLEKQKIVPLFPSSNYVSSSLSINFMWEEVKGATEYTLQVVKPSFSNIQQFVLDTNLTGTKFTYSFQPGSNYEWRIKAKNGSSETEYIVNNFIIDSTLSLTNQVVQLISPANNLYSNDSTQTFTWTSMALANDYRFEILNSLGSIVYQQPATLNTKLNYTFQTEGIYKWRVQAHNDNGSTSNFAVNNLVIDFTAPNVSTPLSPDNNASVSSPALLNWSRSDDAYKDSLIIASDSLFNNIVEKSITASTTYSFKGSSGSNYFWKLKTVDQAGNWSENQSQVYKFKLN